MTPDDRFDAKVVTEPNTGCHLWSAHTNASGYGSFKVGGRPVLAHRFAWERANSQIPAGLTIDHLCRVRSCVNPEHMRVVTQRENLHAPGSRTVNAIHAAKTHCPSGHPYDDANTYVWAGKRYCRACNARLQRERRRHEQ